MSSGGDKKGYSWTASVSKEVMGKSVVGKHEGPLDPHPIESLVEARIDSNLFDANKGTLSLGRRKYLDGDGNIHLEIDGKEVDL